MKKRIVSFLLISIMASMMFACGPSDMVGVSDDSNQSSDTQQLVDELKEKTEDQISGEEGGEQDNQNEETFENTADTVADGLADSLEDYAAHCKRAGILYATVEYEENKQDDYVYYMSKGLEDSDNNMEGVIDWEIFDFDQDNDNELVTLDLVKAESDWNVYATVYELENKKVVKKDSQIFLKGILGSGCDSMQLRFMLKDEKYLCLDSQQYYFVCADGVTYDIDAFSYDGQRLVKMAEYGISGSDLSDVGKESTELVDQLNTMGFSKTAAAVYDRDSFCFCMADSGIRVLSKLEMKNSYTTNDKTHQYAPYASIYYCEGLEPVSSFVLPDSNVREIKKEELEVLTKKQLRIARNEIYARYGWFFKDEELDWYFRQNAWYCPYENITDEILSDVEKNNQKLIAEVEKKAKDDKEVILGGETKLSQEELDQIQTLFDSVEFNGFLCSTYEDPKDINLAELFYNGAGIQYSGDEDEIVKLYLDKTQSEELCTDLTVLEESKIQEYLKTYTRYQIADMNYKMSYLYIPEKKAYCYEHGDTNYHSVSVKSGYKSESGNDYTIYAKDNWEEDNTEDNIYVIKLKKDGDLFRPISVRK